ncbi:TRAP-type C4-dicarboxylate transport system permease small subunit [Caldalkalibacillus uzonensis]|uniref:TRAP-type C4-dicarboxylate transport system permease small subunit n=1 Tax=Caldalkalibacillus uzonensis TaxID=353224 RepID=A0ABU0CPM8_9BACI|nr:TRAP transporter small permease [Caldalkalibacillus uzonensis]MDQ0338360.1 TRAP-type C4-dicarboxylate transport system permease small subunit [Caldalkalibacillus uzonensis]
MENKQSHKLRKIFDSMIANLCFIGAVWIVFLMVIIFADVVGRGLFNTPIPGIPEIVKNSIVGLTFLQIAHVLRKGRHIRTTVIYDRVPQYWKKVLDTMASLAGMIVFIMIFFATLEPAYRAFVTWNFEGNYVRIPTFPTYALILLGSLLMTLQFALSMYDSLRRPRAKTDKGA